jgi:hypothetical protein
LFPLDQLRAAAVPQRALVLAVNGRAATSPDAVARELRRPGPVTVVHVEHEGRRFFAALPPTP